MSEVEIIKKYNKEFKKNATIIFFVLKELYN